MAGWKQSGRAALDRFLKHYFDQVADDIAGVRDELQNVRQSVGDELRGAREGFANELSAVRDELGTTRNELGSTRDEARGARDEARGAREVSSGARDDVFALVKEIRDRLGPYEAEARSMADEIRGLRESSDQRLDLANLRLHQILDEVGGVRDRTERLEKRFGEVEARVVEQLEGQAKRQAELRAGLDQVAKDMKKAMEKLELLFLAQLEGLFGAVHSETATLRADVVELTRMIRMQGDAADQVAEALGRTFTRLSAEVDSLTTAVARLGTRPEEASRPA